jgi:hypothetical protein
MPHEYLSQFNIYDSGTQRYYFQKIKLHSDQNIWIAEDKIKNKFCICDTDFVSPLVWGERPLGLQLRKATYAYDIFDALKLDKCKEISFTIKYFLAKISFIPYFKLIFKIFHPSLHWFLGTLPMHGLAFYFALLVSKYIDFDFYITLGCMYYIFDSILILIYKFISPPILNYFLICHKIDFDYFQNYKMEPKHINKKLNSILPYFIRPYITYSEDVFFEIENDVFWTQIFMIEMTLNTLIVMMILLVRS